MENLTLKEKLAVVHTDLFKLMQTLRSQIEALRPITDPEVVKDFKLIIHYGKKVEGAIDRTDKMDVAKLSILIERSRIVAVKVLNRVNLRTN